MSETLRDLVVSLSLDSSNFTRNLRSINAQIKQAESEFRLAGAGIDSFGETMSGQRAKADSLRKTLDLQTLATEQYAQKLAEAQQKQENAQQNYDHYKAKLQETIAAHASLGQGLHQAQSDYALAAASLGENSVAARVMKTEMDSLEEQYTASGAAITFLTAQVHEEHEALQEATTATARAQAQLNDAEAAARRTQAALSGTEQAMAGMRKTWMEAGTEQPVLPGMDSEAFRNSLRLISIQMKAAESEFRLAGAGIEDFGSTIEGQQAKVKMLQEMVELQSHAVDVHAQKMDAAAQAYTETSERYETLNTALSNSRKAHSDLTQSLEEAKNRYTEYATTLGETDAQTLAAEAELEALYLRYTESAQALEELTAETEESRETLLRSIEALPQARADLNDARAELIETEQELDEAEQELARLSDAWISAGESIQQFSVRLGRVGEALTTAGQSLTNHLTRPIINLGKQAIQASMSYESAFASVRKTLNATEEEFQALSDGIEEMSTHLATSAEDITETVEAAAHLGIATGDLLDFTHTMINLQNTTNMSASDAATNIARFANIVGYAGKTAEEQEDYWARLGSTLVSLGMQNATTESEIMEMSMRIAAAGHQVGMTEQQILGVSTALSSLGINAQAGGTSFSKALIRMQVAVETQNKELKSFAKVSGMSAKEFSKAWKENPVEAFQAFIIGLSRMNDEETSAIGMLQEMGITEIRLRDTILRTANATELFATTQRQANEAFQSSDTLTEKASQRLATAAAKTENLKNQVSRMMRTFGNDLLPVLGQIVDKAGEVLNRFMGMDESTRHSIETYALFAAAAGPALLVIGKLVTTMSTLYGHVGTAVSAIGRLHVAVQAAGGGVNGLTTVIGSSKAGLIGVTVALTAALVAGCAVLYDYATGAKAARDAIEGMKKAAEGWSGTAAETFYARNGLQNLGFTTEAFERYTLEGTELLTQMDSVWAASAKKSNKVVSDLTSSFHSLTDKTRTALKELQKNASSFGMGDMAKSMQADLNLLEHIDDRIEEILKGAKNRALTDAERADMEALLTQKQDIEIRYHLVEGDNGGGFDQIRAKVAAEERRAQARGETAGLDVYKDAVVATAQGLAQLNQQLDTEYDQRYRLLQMQYEGGALEEKKAELDSQYAQERSEALQSYAATLAEVMQPVWNSDGNQQVNRQVSELYRLSGAYADALARGENGTDVLEKMKELSEGMDEGAFTEYYTMLTQINDLLALGMDKGEVEKLFGIDLDGEMGRFAELTAFAKEHKDTLGGLASMFGESLPAEIIRIAADLDLTTAKETWSEFSTNPAAILPDAVIQKYGNKEGVDPESLVSQLNAAIKKYKSTGDPNDLVGALLAVVAGYSSKDPSEQLVGALAAVIASYSDGTLDPSALVSSLMAVIGAYSNGENADPASLVGGLLAIISAYSNGENTDPDGLVSALVAYIASYANQSGNTPDGLVGALAAVVASYANGDLDPSSLVSALSAVITQYENKGAPADLVNGLKAVVSAYANGEETDPNALVSALFAYVASYSNDNGANPNSLVAALMASVSGYMNTGDPASLVAGLLAIVSAYSTTKDPSLELLSGLLAVISGYSEGEYADPNAFVESLMAIIGGYTNGEDIDPDSLVGQLWAIVSGYGESDDADPDALVNALLGVITDYVSKGDAGVGVRSLSAVITRYLSIGKVPTPHSSLVLDSYTRTALDAYLKENPITVASRARVSDFVNKPSDLLNDPNAANATVWKDGVKVPLTAQIVSKLKPSDLVVLDEDGKMHIIVVPEYSGTEKDLSGAASDFNSDIWAGLANGFEMIQSLNLFAKPMIDHPEQYQSLFGGDSRKKRLEEQTRQLWYKPMGSDMTYFDIMGGLIGNFGAAFQNGSTVPAEALKQLQAIQQLLDYMTQIGANADIRTQLAADLQAAGIDVNADTLSETMGNMLRQLAQANGYEDTGELIAAGIGAGMTGHDYSAEGQATVSNVKKEIEEAAGIKSPAKRFIPTGDMIAAGIGEGIAKRSFVQVARQAAQNLLEAVRSALGIHSPSELFAAQVGAYAAAGIGEGFLRELPGQAAIIGNAARFLPDAARGNVTYNTNTISKAYDDSVSLSVDKMIMRNEMDAQALAEQIAGIGRRSRHARGSR